MTKPFKIKLRRFSKQKLGSQMGQVFLAMISFAFIIFVGVPTFAFKKLEFSQFIEIRNSDLFYLLLFPLGALFGRYIKYFDQAGEIIITEEGVTIIDGNLSEFRSWSQYQISFFLDGYIEQKVNGKKRPGNRNYVLIASPSGTEKHFFQVFGKIQMNYLLQHLETVHENTFILKAS